MLRLEIRQGNSNGDTEGAACEVGNQENCIPEKNVVRRCNQLSFDTDKLGKIRTEN